MLMSKVGRPTKYNPEFCNKVKDYLENATKENMHMPKIESFALFLGVNKDTLYEWAKEHKEFSDALRDIMTVQAERLIDDGIYGGKEVNATIIKLLLQNNHGMKERVDNTTNDKEVNQVLVKFIDGSTNN